MTACWKYSCQDRRGVIMSYMGGMWQGIKGIEYNMFYVTTGRELDIYVYE